MRLVAALAALSLLLAAPGAAQEVPQPPDIPPGEDRIESLALRAPAPFAGMLLDTDTAIRWTHRLEWYRAELQLQLRTSASLLAAERSSHETQLRLVAESFGREIEGLRNDLREQAARYEAELARLRAPEPFWESWGFAFGMGVLVTGVVVAAVGGLVIGL